MGNGWHSTIDGPRRNTRRPRHAWTWATFPGDTIGPCPDGMSHSHVVGRVCRYCWAQFAPERSEQLHCSKLCADRNAAHAEWIRETREAAKYGRPGPRAPRGGASLTASVARFAIADDAPALFATA
jgi:hypothetical protein